jgi:pre-mRNA-splicing factor CWC22
LTCLSAVPEKEGIEDLTETNLVNLRRVIYLTIMNALNYEEAVHKLLKVQLQEGEEVWFYCLLVFSVAYMHSRWN